MRETPLSVDFIRLCAIGMKGEWTVRDFVWQMDGNPLTDGTRTFHVVQDLCEEGRLERVRPGYYRAPGNQS